MHSKIHAVDEQIDRDDVVKEVEAEGFHLTKKLDHLPFMYVLVFEKR